MKKKKKTFKDEEADTSRKNLGRNALGGPNFLSLLSFSVGKLKINGFGEGGGRSHISFSVSESLSRDVFPVVLLYTPLHLTSLSPFPPAHPCVFFPFFL
ncbi:hypothetical protein Phum_PHUM265810 [Pediculus humanus corporis]|uniref:Uncharacterized protein n=1 Tax=Pediculus humanus subsp. corporis TaxID=121224 RepID=E0VKJ3_PEDHC|nr:uncharacterized protein Phum_PHUM265810 [Pediculus humanus corporis]EEB13899.1 hypothetical protein Phum_PHUM265810 [Pediculus humanus corporis]